MGNSNSYITIVKNYTDLDTLYNKTTLYKENHTLIIYCKCLEQKDVIDKIMSIYKRCSKFKLKIGYTNKNINEINFILSKANKLSNNTFFSITKIYYININEEENNMS